MSDLIKREDAIKEISELVTSMSVCVSVDECHGMKRMQGMAVRALEALPSAEQKVYVILYDEAGHERDHYSMVKVFDNLEEASKCMDVIAKGGGVFTYRVETVYSEQGEEE